MASPHSFQGLANTQSWLQRALNLLLFPIKSFSSAELCQEITQVVKKVLITFSSDQWKEMGHNFYMLY